MSGLQRQLFAVGKNTSENKETDEDSKSRETDIENGISRKFQALLKPKKNSIVSRCSENGAVIQMYLYFSTPVRRLQNVFDDYVIYIPIVSNEEREYLISTNESQIVPRTIERTVKTLQCWLDIIDIFNSIHKWQHLFLVSELSHESYTIQINIISTSSFYNDRIFNIKSSIDENNTVFTVQWMRGSRTEKRFKLEEFNIHELRSFISEYYSKRFLLMRFSTGALISQVDRIHALL